MKKYGYLLAVLLLVLVGCGRSAAPADAGTSDAGAADAGTTDAGAAPAPLDLDVTYEYLSEWEDQKNILNATAPVLRILNGGYEKLQSALDSCCGERLRSVTKDYEDRLPDAKRAYEENKENFPGYYMENSVLPERSDERIISLRATESSYFGGAHPNYFVGGMNFNPADGTELSLSDVVTDVEALYEYSKKYLKEAVGEENLFPAYEESLSAHFHDSSSSPVQWIFDSEGLRLLFSPYDLGPYAMGSIEVFVPYDDGGLIKEEYLLNGKGLAKRIPAEEVHEVDLDGDGTREVLRLTARDSVTDGEPDYAGLVTVGTGSSEESMKTMEYLLPGDFEEAYLMRTKEGSSYLYVVSSGDNDYSLMEIFDLNGETPAHVETVNSTPQEHLLSGPDNFTLYTRLDALGTYQGRRRYAVGENGVPEALDTLYELDPGSRWARPITAQKAVPVWMAKDGADGEKVRTELPAGTEFCLRRTDGETFAEAELTDGRVCEIRYEVKEGIRTIEGTNEWEYFNDLPYAG